MNTLKLCLAAVSLVIAFPAGICVWLERAVGSQRDAFFQFWAQGFSHIPDLPGHYLRRAFYRLTIKRCDRGCLISFGTFLAHRNTTVENGVYVGPYAVIGSANLGKRCLIGTRVSIINGPNLHVLQPDGTWSGPRWDAINPIRIGDDAWIGEGSIVMADVGDGALVAAGSVVSQAVPSRVVVAGNPARFVRHLAAPCVESEVESNGSNNSNNGDRQPVIAHPQ